MIIDRYDTTKQQQQRISFVLSVIQIVSMTRFEWIGHIIQVLKNKGNINYAIILCNSTVDAYVVLRTKPYDGTGHSNRLKETIKVNGHTTVLDDK